MRVLFATDYLHVPQGGGGSERNTHELCLALLAQGDSPAVSCHFPMDGSWLSWSSRIRRAAPPRREHARDTVCGYPVFRGWNQAKVTEVVSRFVPDVIIVQSTHPEALLRALAPTRVPVVAYFHEVEQLEHLISLRASGIPVIANSRFTASRLATTCGLQCEVLLPLIDPKHYVGPRAPDSVLFVNTSQRKGVEIAFALAEARPAIPFHFMLSRIHTPTEHAALRARAAKSGNIILQAPTQDMRTVYSRTKVVLAPSQWEEAWGRVATEAHVNAIPVIGSDRGGLPDAIGPGGIILSAAAPATEWANALDQLWHDAAAYSAASEAARAYAARPEIQPETIVRHLRSILQKNLNR